MIDVIVTYHNKEKYIEECIYSIHMSITRIPYKITIVDDCSDEPLPNISSVDIVRTPRNLKISGARNFGVKNTSNPLILFIDADDTIPDNYIQECYDTLVSNNVDIVYNDFVIVEPTGNRSTTNFPEFDGNNLREYPFIHCSSLYKREVWNANNGYDENMIYGWEDYDFWLKSYKNNFKFKKTSNTKLFYRQTEETTVNKIAGENLTTKIKPYLREKYPNFYMG